jgi:hypothetical protein
VGKRRGSFVGNGGVIMGIHHEAIVPLRARSEQCAARLPVAGRR